MKFYGLSNAEIPLGSSLSYIILYSPPIRK
jgi:hypothetical protein